MEDEDLWLSVHAACELFAGAEGSERPAVEMDLLIATAAVRAQAPLLTRNVRDFARVPGVEVLTY